MSLGKLLGELKKWSKQFLKTWLRYKLDNFDLYNVLLDFATNIPVLLKTGFVVQGHI